MKKVFRFLSISMFLLCAVLLVSAGKVSAATAKVLYSGSFDDARTFSRYDVTGDGKADKVKVSVAKDKYDQITSVKVSVNGRKALTLKSADYALAWGIEIVRLSGGTVYTHFSLTTDDDYALIDRIYKYSKGKYVSVYDLRKVVKSRKVSTWGTKSGFSAAVYSSTISAVKGNRLTIDGSLMPGATGLVAIRFYLKPSGGKLKRTSNTVSIRKVSGSPSMCQPGKYVKALKNLKVYRSATSGRRAFTIKKGAKFKAVNIYLSNGKCRLKVQNTAGKTGYIDLFQQTVDKSRGYSLYYPVGEGWFYAG